MVPLNLPPGAPWHFSSVRKTLKKPVIDAQDPGCSLHLTLDRELRDSPTGRRYGLLTAFDRLTTGERHGKVRIGLGPWSAGNSVGGCLPNHASLSAASDCALIFADIRSCGTANMVAGVAGAPDSVSCLDLDSPGRVASSQSNYQPAICSRC